MKQPPPKPLQPSQAQPKHHHPTPAQCSLTCWWVRYRGLLQLKGISEDLFLFEHLWTSKRSHLSKENVVQDTANTWERNSGPCVIITGSVFWDESPVDTVPSSRDGVLMARFWLPHEALRHIYFPFSPPLPSYNIMIGTCSAQSHFNEQAQTRVN